MTQLPRITRDVYNSNLLSRMSPKAASAFIGTNNNLSSLLTEYETQQLQWKHKVEILLKKQLENYDINWRSVFNAINPDNVKDLDDILYINPDNLEYVRLAVYLCIAQTNLMSILINRHDYKSLKYIAELGYVNGRDIVRYAAAEKRYDIAESILNDYVDYHIYEYDVIQLWNGLINVSYKVNVSDLEDHYDDYDIIITKQKRIYAILKIITFLLRDYKNDLSKYEKTREHFGYYLNESISLGSKNFYEYLAYTIKAPLTHNNGMVFASAVEKWGYHLIMDLLDKRFTNYMMDRSRATNLIEAIIRSDIRLSENSKSARVRYGQIDGIVDYMKHHDLRDRKDKSYAYTIFNNYIDTCGPDYQPFKIT